MARILVVDDEPDVREFIKDALVLDGHSVETSYDGSDALERLRRKRYDLVILDKNMPRTSGLEVVAALRKLPEGKGVKVLMCTASGMMSDVDGALASGADDYIIKPIELARLQEKVALHAPTTSERPALEPGGLRGLLQRIFPPRA